MEGIYAYLELLHTVVQQKLTHYKAILLQIKFFINSTDLKCRKNLDKNT